MKPIKMFGLAALAALLAMAFVGASSAMAATTKLCKHDPETLSEGGCSEITHVHETSVGKAKLLSEPTVECNVLFLGDTVAGTSAPLHISGTFTYSSCNNSCTVEEKNGPALITVLRTASELAEVTGEGLVELTCFFGFIHCSYNGEGLAGHGLGPLTSSQANGSVVITGQETHIETGSCPAEAFLDITTTPLEAVYLGGQAQQDYCVKYERTVGFYLNVNGKSECIEKDTARVGRYGLVEGKPGLTNGTMVCVDLLNNVGLYKKISANREKCEEDDGTNTSLYELAEVQ